MMKSTPETREKLRERLNQGLTQSPDNQELKDALAIVNDLIKYHTPLSNKGLYVFYDTEKNRVYLFDSSDMSLMHHYEWNRCYESLGLLVTSCLDLD
jgi:hypothetical protein